MDGRSEEENRGVDAHRSLLEAAAANSLWTGAGSRGIRRQIQKENILPFDMKF